MPNIQAKISAILIPNETTAMTDDKGKPIRALFVAGLNLGTKKNGAEQFLECLRQYEPEAIYLMGDMLAYREWKSSFNWPQAHNDIVQKLLRQARRGAKILYIPGDRDGFMRHYGATELGGIKLVNDAVHETVSGKRLLVTHGDAFDLVAPSLGFLGKLGARAIGIAVGLSRLVEITARTFGLFVHDQTYRRSREREAPFVDSFAATALSAAAAEHFDGIICGHLPHPESRTINGMPFFSTGDWRTCASALIEHLDGQFEFIPLGVP